MSISGFELAFLGFFSGWVWSGVGGFLFFSGLGLGGVLAVVAMILGQIYGR